MSQSLIGNEVLYLAHAHFFWSCSAESVEVVEVDVGAEDDNQYAVHDCDTEVLLLCRLDRLSKFFVDLSMLEQKNEVAYSNKFHSN